MKAAAASLLTFALSFLTACATDIGTGTVVVKELESEYPITVGKLVSAHLDPSRRLRVYLQICRDAGINNEPVCSEDDLRVLAMAESSEKKLLQRLAERYLNEGKDMPIYVYGPRCEGLKEMVLVPRCQTALAIGIWDPHLRDYIVYSTMHGDTVLESDGFENFLEVTARATGVVRKAAKYAP